MQVPRGMREVTAPEPRPRVPVLEIAVPVYNEEAQLAQSVTRLHHYLDTHLPVTACITIVDNASTDGTWALACTLASSLRGVTALHLDQKGRGRALRAAWTTSESDIVAYMDVDLSTDLNAVLPLVAPLLSGHSEVSVGSRLARGARVIRGTRRELISRAYNLILRTVLRARFTDAQCGFKALRREVAQWLVPLVEDDAWFFDTELLILAQRFGLRVFEVPVDWVDDADSRVDVVATALADLRGILRLLRRRFRGLGRQLLTFATIGVISTLTYLALYAGLRVVTTAFVANLLALGITTIANTTANRRLTFGLRGRQHLGRHQAGGAVAFAFALALTTGALALLSWADPAASRATEIVVVVVANLVATALRFVLLRRWIGASVHTRQAGLRAAHRELA